jgi:hypothetical protein
MQRPHYEAFRVTILIFRLLRFISVRTILNFPSYGTGSWGAISYYTFRENIISHFFNLQIHGSKVNLNFSAMQRHLHSLSQIHTCNWCDNVGYFVYRLYTLLSLYCHIMTIKRWYTWYAWCIDGIQNIQHCEYTRRMYYHNIKIDVTLIEHSESCPKFSDIRAHTSNSL